MKFRIKLILLATLLINILISSQHLKVEYEKYDLKDIDHNSNLTKEYQDKVNTERKKPQKYFLYYTDGYSFFKSIPRNSISHNAGDKKENDVQIHKREIYKEIELKMYHNKNDDGNYAYHNFKDTNEEFYGYKDTKFAKIEYKDDTMNIDNYVCKLVEVSFDSMTNYKVWYTEAIPISAGPFSFNNFPGLVLRVETENYTITATKISNDAKESDIEKINTRLKVFKNEDYDKKLKEVNEQRSKPTFEEIKL
ncbi:GLPGLI family protein [Chryseobacterium sp. T16E-39]|uniref:GLPGLI family protein n=1 Tax=Chryseobacterium sp. T16E-39 TaxID=2015076 RepID=UPI0012F86B8C|nr:GLPGLI family protein [Chryseobacterium sp. T16E-39]